LVDGGDAMTGIGQSARHAVPHSRVGRQPVHKDERRTAAIPCAHRQRHVPRHGDTQGLDEANLLLVPVILLAVALGYVLGTFPSADLAARFATGGARDIRTMGSGNPGAANVLGELGKKWGAFVLVLDIAKGAAACAVARWIADDPGACAAGSAAVIGHCFPLWNGFRGGKGIATAGGQVLMTFPAILPVEFVLVGLGRKLRSRIYGAVCAVWVAGAAVWWAADLPNLWGTEPSAALLWSALLSAAVILYRFAAAKPPADVTTSPT
jgi:glycerol-3-phosphate acyltransferase PlsY